MKNRIALITGISGQDGPYLAKFLLKKNYKVFGTTRKKDNVEKNLNKLKILESIEIEENSLLSFSKTRKLIKSISPDEIYHLSSQSSVGLSFNKPLETIKSVVLSTKNILDSCILGSSKIYHAGSSECFGNSINLIDENTEFSPLSPYAAAKCSSHWLVKYYREKYKIFCCSGFLFNHESPLRSEKYVTQKIIRGAYDIHSGKKKKLILGNLDIKRDWGWAPEYVETMWKILQKNKPEDFIVATGKTSSLKEFAKMSFEYFGLNWENYVEINPELFRPNDIKEQYASSSKALKEINWKAKNDLSLIIKKMMKEID
jgi:GDPmannose 4,6-dehydratase